MPGKAESPEHRPSGRPGLPANQRLRVCILNPHTDDRGPSLTFCQMVRPRRPSSGCVWAACSCCPPGSPATGPDSCSPVLALIARGCCSLELCSASRDVPSQPQALTPPLGRPMDTGKTGREDAAPPGPLGPEARPFRPGSVCRSRESSAPTAWEVKSGEATPQNATSSLPLSPGDTSRSCTARLQVAGGGRDEEKTGPRVHARHPPCSHVLSRLWSRGGAPPSHDAGARSPKPVHRLPVRAKGTLWV